MKRLILAVLAVFLVAEPAAAQTATQAVTLPEPPKAKPADPKPGAEKPAAPGVLRGSPSAPGATALRGETPGIRRRVPDTALMSPGLVSPAAPRLTRDIETALGGGGQCRTQCAQEMYFCRGGDDGGGCDDIWRKCVLACPSQSGSAP